MFSLGPETPRSPGNENSHQPPKGLTEEFMGAETPRPKGTLSIHEQGVTGPAGASCGCLGPVQWRVAREDGFGPQGRDHRKRSREVSRMRVQVTMGSITTIQLVVVGWRLEMLTQCSATSNVYRRPTSVLPMRSSLRAVGKKE